MQGRARPPQPINGGICRGQFEKSMTRDFQTGKQSPATMIEKVAVSQALRNAFPKDFEGLYTPEEMPTIGTETKAEKTPPEANAIPE